MSPTKKGPLILPTVLLILSGVLGSDWSVTYSSTSICGLKGSFVDIPCTYTYPEPHQIKETFWLFEWIDGTKKHNDISQHLRYQGRVEYLGDEVGDCTLRIKDLDEDDTEERYRFRMITDNGRWSGNEVSLSVTDLDVDMSPASVSVGDTVTLTCKTTCSLSTNPTYIWYRNSQPLNDSHTTSSNTLTITSVRPEDTGNYSCAVSGHEDHSSSPSMCVPNAWSVTYTPESICALKGSSVELHSYYTYPCDHTVTKAFWTITRPQNVEPLDLMEDADYRGRVNYTEYDKNRNTLNIKDLRLEDSNLYRFMFTTEGEKEEHAGEPVELSVTGLQVLVDPAVLFEGDKVTLTCITTCNLSTNPTYIWYRNSQPLINNHSADNRLVIESAGVEDAGIYSCAVVGHENHSSLGVTLDVRYSPRNISVLVSQEGKSVNLTCSSDANPPADIYTWYRTNEAETVLHRDVEKTLHLDPAVDHGLYHCEAYNEVGSRNSTAVAITLAGPSWLRIILFFSVLGALCLVLLMVVILACWRKQKTQNNAQGASAPVYDNAPATLVASLSAQTAIADDAQQCASVELANDDAHYASVKFKPNKQQEDVGGEDDDDEEELQYASVLFRKHKPESTGSDTPLSASPQEETEYASVNVKGLTAAT